jgi:hypothetical protein
MGRLLLVVEEGELDGLSDLWVWFSRQWGLRCEEGWRVDAR